MLRLAQSRLVDPISASLRVARAVHMSVAYPELLLLSQVAVHFLTLNRIKTYRIGLGEQIYSNHSVAGALVNRVELGRCPPEQPGEYKHNRQQNYKYAQSGHDPVPQFDESILLRMKAFLCRWKIRHRLIAFGPGIPADQKLETSRTKTSTRPLAEISNSVQQRNKSCGQ